MLLVRSMCKGQPGRRPVNRGGHCPLADPLIHSKELQGVDCPEWVNPKQHRFIFYFSSFPQQDLGADRLRFLRFYYVKGAGMPTIHHHRVTVGLADSVENVTLREPIYGDDGVEGRKECEEAYRALITMGQQMGPHPWEWAQQIWNENKVIRKHEIAMLFS
ncbi:hypothetical protein CEXT_617151 [Caerostris extrusa]|uniref:Uncharacterized protein n=1 Tax=Caerostris extrusa TaxID=172846 RepID=A0AAV4XTP8_CAEEX|nr:hypothetical protein CEXT_617151 [Caerostris extrusa]